MWLAALVPPSLRINHFKERYRALSAVIEPLSAPARGSRVRQSATFL